MVQVPISRITTLNDSQPDVKKSEYVVYWMIAFKRVEYNFALERAIEWANKLSQPLVIFEPLILDYPMSSIRFHKFTLDGMKEVSETISKSNAFYYPFVETKPKESEQLLGELAKKASVVVTDDYPTYFVPQMIAKASGDINTRYELVDSNGLVPIRLAEKEYVRAHDFRRYLHKNLEDFLIEVPEPEPLNQLNKEFNSKSIENLFSTWKPFDFENTDVNSFLVELEIDKSVEVSHIEGGRSKAITRMSSFIENGFNDYAQHRSDPSKDASSRFHLISILVIFQLMKCSKLFQNMTVGL